jgi:hypothetical protein
MIPAHQVQGEGEPVQLCASLMVPNPILGSLHDEYCLVTKAA